MIDPLLAAGRLPNLHRLLERGTSARLRSTVIPISSAAWCSAVTGKHPGQTGVFSFFEGVPGSYEVRLIDSRSNRATPVWRTLARRRLRSLVLGVPVTYPPEPIPGIMVAGMLSPPGAVYTHPPELADQLRRRGLVPDLGIWQRDRSILRPAAVDRHLTLKQELVLELLLTEQWNLAWIVFKELDVVSHALYDGSLDGRVAKLYGRLDEILGSLIDAVGDDTNVLVLSDHGFSAYFRQFDTQSWLLQEGLATVREDSRPQTVLPRPLAQKRAAEHLQRIRQLDLSRTLAFATAAEGNFGSIRLNVAGREPEGIVEPADMEALSQEISRRLRAVDTPDGGALVTWLQASSELYPGPRAGLLPDLLFEVDESFIVRTSRSGPVFRRFDRPAADHDVYGILIGAGPDIASRDSRGEASIFDIAPTALNLLGLPIYDDLAGAVYADFFRVPPRPRRTAEADDPPDLPELWPHLEAREAPPSEEVTDRLRALGYVD